MLAAWLILLLAAIHPPGGTNLPLCPSRLLLDTPCPGCGLTRSISSAARARLGESVAHHPFGVLILPAAAAAALTPLIPRRFRAAVLPIASPLRRLAPVIAGLFAAGMLLFGLLRVIL